MVRSIAAATVLFPLAAMAQMPLAQPSWQDLALRTQQNATVQQMLDNAMISALQNEIAALKAQPAAKPDPPGDAGHAPSAPSEEKK